MKNNSVLKTAALVGAMTATGVVATTTAHADAAATTTTTQQSANTAEQQLSNLKSQQTTNENQLAAQNKTQYDSAASDANSQITKLQDQLKSQQASQAAADKPALTSGTAKINSQASQATASENAAYSSAVASQSTANQRELANAAKNIVTPAQKTQQESAAKSAYDKSKADLDAQHSAKNDQIKADYEAAVKKATDAAKANQTAAERQHTQAVEDATKAVDDASAKVKSLTDINNANQSKLNDAKSSMTNIQNQLKQTTSSEFVPHVTISGDRHGADFRLNVSDDDEDKILKDKRPLIYVRPNGTKYCITRTEDKNHAYVYHYLVVNNQGQLTGETLPNDMDTTNDYIAANDLQEVTVWAANVLNQARALVGTVPVHVSQESIAAAEDAMQQYIAKGEGFIHDTSIYENVARKYSLPNFASSISDESRIEEDGMTVGILKLRVLGAIQEFISDADNMTPGNYGHRYHLLGLDDNGNISNEDWGMENYGTPYFAFGDTGCINLTTPYTSELFNKESFHIFVSTDGYNQHEIPLTDFTTSRLQKALDQAQSTYDSTYVAAQDSAKKLANAKTQLTNAQSKLANLQKSQGTTAQDKALQAKISDLTKTRDEAVQKENASYNAAIKKLDANYQAKLDAIKKLPTNVDQLKAQLQAKLDTLKKDHEAKLAKINADAEQQIADLKAKLAKSHDAENQPIIDKIAQLKASLVSLKTELAAKLTDLKTKDINEYNALKNQLEPKAVASEVAKGNVNSYQFGGNTIELTTESSNSNHASLPQTGNNSSFAIVALGAVVSMLGLGMTAKKREE